jgi:threonyl-tRNA synthetase
MSEQLQNKRHSLAHLLAIAALKHDPKALLSVGPATDTGFYYDILFSEGKTPTPEDLKSFEKTMRHAIKQNLSFERKEVSHADAKKRFEGNQFKLTIVEDKEKEGVPLSLYHTGEFTDLCAGGHVDNTKELSADAFTLTNIAGAYWRGDESNPMLTRIYGVAFETKEELEAYQKQQEEARARDHKKLGRELDLFTFSDTVGKGLPLWTEKGTTVRRELERFIVDEELKRGYIHVVTPDIAKLDLYKKSGHYPHYKESMYAPIDIDGEEFMLRPMTCPHHFELYLRKPHSYKELPLRIAELAQLYRYEQSGELSGLERVRTFCLADAHIICKDEAQAIEEIGQALDLIEYIASVFGLIHGDNYWYRLSLGNRENKEKYYDNDAAWNTSEDLLRKLLLERGSHFVEEQDEAAFYGPKIDIQMKNVNGKENTAFTVQYDFCMPDRFDLSYTDETGNQKRAVVVHRSSIGAIERIMAFLIERYAGAFPLWLSPTQITILPVSDKFLDTTLLFEKVMRENNIRVTVDQTNDSLGKRIREAKMQKTPYVLVVGEKESNGESLTLEGRGDEKVSFPNIHEVVEFLTKKIRTRE